MTVATKAVSALDMLKSAAKSAKKDSKPILNSPDLESTLRAFLKHTSDAESHETLAKQAKDQLLEPARAFLMAECERTGKTMSSITIQCGELKATYSLKSQYCDVAVTDKPILEAVFGEETSKFFKDKLEIKIKDEAMTDEVLGKLVEIIGIDNLEIKNTIKVTEGFHNQFVGSAAFREKCHGLIESGKVRPYAASIKQ